ncbi:glycoside hydrolase family 65 protein [Enterococcus sp. DIV0849a]|uniref:glycoside hydrolase family 65 protein n=1 Tax=unclassified Enterococcus TaxID=2608891 RepID=UPI0024142976|nr:glycoside hydrolase family 65 protein [Enterococcus sp. DIV0849a]
MQSVAFIMMLRSKPFTGGERMNHLFEIDPWKIATHQLERNKRRLQESLTSMGNGYMGMRGNFEEQYTGDHHQGTYLAGVWYPDKTRVGWWKNGYPEYFGKVINAIDFIAMDIFVNGEALDLGIQDPKDFYLELDMRNGLLTRTFTFEQGETSVKFSFERFLSIVQQELAVIRVTVEVLKGIAAIEIVSKIDGDVRNEDSNYDEMFWEAQQSGFEEAIGFLTTRTIPNPFGIEQFTVTAAMKHVTDAKAGIAETEPLKVQQAFQATLQPNEIMSLGKQVIILTSRDLPETEQQEKSVQLLKENTKTFDELLKEQNEAWAARWALADVVIEGDDAAQQGIRFNLFQLFTTYYGEDERLNIGPKGFTGEKYGGATYWDTEAYAVPLYLALAKPEVTKNLLKYRYNQLEQAKYNARQQGLAGALYPMVTFTGIECHNEWEITFEEIHRNGAIAYAIYNYVNYTGDNDYLKNEGLQVLTEIARFWADRVHFSKRAQKYMIHGVTGPNEYENNSNNNWYTNTIATWVLQYTLDNYRKYQEETPVEITKEEQAHWQEIVENMYYPFDEELGVFVQHDTFLDKDLMPRTALTPADLPLNQHWSWDRILRSCFIKQADVLQGIYFFGERFSRAEKERNFLFYEPMTVHESSLSPSVHAILAAELGMEEKAVEMYQRTARLDLDNYNNDTEDGLHITSMTGSWLAIVQGFAQMKTADEKLSFAPFLPSTWTSYAFHVNYRGRLLYVTVDKENVRIQLVSGSELPLTLYGNKMVLVDELVCAMEKVNEHV